ncbi:hypothetical protein CDL12_15397 [Handroanthus impetiginosus]|uniref:Retrotransposon Copia-like N-terminal domain-containing protein n=1 Tax=Handroanthus impetiginosus TaxID=429701 RepID=A0A2G9H381_9LAMI|nr:hypothetical protein CDL12_15397 [Handroanthus impetiginosus]
MASENKATLGTTVKLNGQNYILWSQAFKLFLGSQNKLAHILSSPPDKNDSNGSNARSLTDYFASLKGVADEILLYHPLGCDLQTQQSQWNEFLVAKFLSGLDPSLRPCSRSFSLSRVLRVATVGPSGPLSPLNTENSAMAVRGRGRGSSHGHEGQGGRGRSSTESKGTRYYTYCGRTNHVSKKCWVKFGKPDWANTVTESSQPELDVVTLSRAEYEKLVHCDAVHSRVPSVSSSAVASTTMDAFAASHDLFYITITFSIIISNPP